MDIADGQRTYAAVRSPFSLAYEAPESRYGKPLR